MSRIISLVSLIMIIGGVAYAYYTGLIEQVFNPKVSIVVAQQDLLEDQPVWPQNYDLVEIPLADARSNHIIFPSGTKREDVVNNFADAVFAKEASMNEPLTLSHFSPNVDLFVMGVMTDVSAGQPLDRSKAIIAELEGSIEDGMVVFSDKRKAAETFIENSRFTASRDLQGGKFVTVGDITGGSAAVWVMESKDAFKAGDLISFDDVLVVSRESADLPRGAVAFPSKQAGEIYLSTAGGITLSKGLSEGDVFVVSTIAEVGGSALSDGQLPQSLNELLEYRAKFPATTVFVDDEILVGSEPVEGDSLSLWIETGSTEGSYGVIKIRRVADGAQTFRVSNSVLSDDGPKDESIYWTKVGRVAHIAIEEARNEGRMAFMVSEASSISDFLGNGAVCSEEMCSVSRSVSDDLSIVRLAFGEGGALVSESEEGRPDPLTLLDGVDSTIERRMHSRGYMSFRDIASWEDSALKVISFNLEISQNLAVYIREQARNIMENPEQSRRDLGLTNNDISD